MQSRIVLLFIFLNIAVTLSKSQEFSIDNATTNVPETTTNISTTENTTENGQNSTTPTPVYNITTPLPSNNETTTLIAKTTTKESIEDNKDKEKPPKESKDCPCDKTDDSCDSDCCCDKFCNQDQLDKFPNCTSTLSSRTVKKCLRSNIFFRHNTPYNLRQEGARELFCIVADNYRLADTLKEPKISLDDLKKYAKDSTSWDFGEKARHDKSKESHYRYGDYILAKKNEMISPYKLPSKFNEDKCSFEEPIQFLNTKQVHCKILSQNFVNDCQSQAYFNIQNFIQDILIVLQKVQLDMENDTTDNSQNNVNNVTLLEIKSFICPNDTLELFTSTLSNCEPLVNNKELDKYRPEWDGLKKICRNVLYKLHLIFIHNGTDGIQSIIAKITTKDYFDNSTSTGGNDQMDISQVFRVDYAWSFETGETGESSSKEDNYFQEILNSNWPLSGNPGYIIGKPVIMGKRIYEEVTKNEKNDTQQDTVSIRRSSRLKDLVHNEEEEPEKNKFTISREPQYSLTIADSGLCRDSKRKSVSFGLNHNTYCYLNASTFKTCTDLQMEITKILLGTAAEDFDERYTSHFGNPSLTDIKQWTSIDYNPTQFERSNQMKSSLDVVKNGCENIVASVRINIAYAYVGPHSFPHAKIFKILFDPFDSVNIPPRAQWSKEWKLKLITKVKFSDFTQQPVTKLSRWPSISINLPSDFFYPFASPSAATTNLNKLSLSVLQIIYISLILIDYVLF